MYAYTCICTYYIYSTHFTWSNNISDAEIRNSTVFHKPFPTGMEVIKCTYMYTEVLIYVCTVYIHMYIVIHASMHNARHVYMYTINDLHKAVKLELVCKVFH